MLSNVYQNAGQDAIGRSWRTRLLGKSCLITATVLAVAVLGVGVASAQDSYELTSGPLVIPKQSIPARDLPAALPALPVEINPLKYDGPVLGGERSDVDPAAQFVETEGFALNLLGGPIVNVPGVAGANPNDTNGDIGPNDFVQMINSIFQVFDRQGNPRGGAANINSLWTSADPTDTSECATQNRGDPIVLYDKMADRWLLSQFARNVSGSNSDPGYLCVAISQTPDPTGTYHLYQFETERFPDYFKIGVWPDGYYASANYNGPNTAMVAVMDRANMLNGNPAAFLLGNISTLVNNFDVLIPSTVMGDSPPPAGTPNFFYRQADGALAGGNDRIELYEISINWISGSGTISAPLNISVAPFSSDTCGYPAPCIPQPGTANTLDVLQVAPMYRFPYRNFGDREVLVGNFSVDATGSDEVGIRWFVLERDGGPWALANEGTYAPQPAGAPAFVHRWMGSAAMDRFGNLALGYTASSAQNVSPSARYTGRVASDPLGLMPQPEITIQAGNNFVGQRWGDYYTMSVDPVDDCTFWYTGDSVMTGGGGGGVRQSYIASFRFADCATDLGISKSDSPDPVIAGEQLTYTIAVYNYGPLDETDIEIVDTLPAGVSFISDSLPGAECNDTVEPEIRCNIGDLDAGEYTDFTITVAVDSDLLFAPDGPIEIENTATVSGEHDDTDASNNSDTEVTLVNELADLQVEKICKPDGPAHAGTTPPDGGAKCEIFVTNHGPSGARNVQMVDEIFASGDYNVNYFTDIGNVCSQPGKDIECDLGDMDAGQVIKVTVLMWTDDEIDINDIATATSDTPDPDTSNNSAEGSVTFLGVANLSITKSDNPDSVIAGTSLTYTLDVSNAGPSTAMNVVVTDQVPAGTYMVSATSGSGSCVIGVAGDPAQPTECGLGSLASGASTTVTIVVDVLPDTTGVIHNDATVSSDTLDNDNSDNRATEDTTIEVVTDLVLTKIDDKDPVAAGGELKYLLTLINNGPSTATNVVLTDNLPPETSLVKYKVLGGTDDCIHSASNPDEVKCTVGTLGPDESFVLTISVLVDPSIPDGTTITNCAAVSEDSGLGTDVCEDTLVFTEADLWIDKEGSYITQNPGKNIIYTLTVHNDAGCSGNDPQVCGDGGPSDALDVTVVDTLPVTSKKLVVTFVSEDCVYDEPSHTVTCVTPVLASGDSVDHQIEATPRGNLRQIDNVATVSSTTYDPNAGNNTDNKWLVVGGGGQKGTGE